MAYLVSQTQMNERYMIPAEDELIEAKRLLALARTAADKAFEAIDAYKKAGGAESQAETLYSKLNSCGEF